MARFLALFQTGERPVNVVQPCRFDANSWTDLLSCLATRLEAILADGLTPVQLSLSAWSVSGWQNVAEAFPLRAEYRGPGALLTEPIFKLMAPVWYAEAERLDRLR